MPGTVDSSEGTRFLSSVPALLVADVDTTAAWYRENLGFDVAGIFPKTPPSVWASLQRDAAEIMLQRLEGYTPPNVYALRPGGVWHVYIRMRGVHRFYDSVRHRPCIKMPLRRQPYGDWEFEVEDLNGYVVVFGGDETLNDAPP